MSIVTSLVHVSSAAPAHCVGRGSPQAQVTHCACDVRAGRAASVAAATARRRRPTLREGIFLVDVVVGGRGGEVSVGRMQRVEELVLRRRRVVAIIGLLVASLAAAEV